MPSADFGPYDPPGRVWVAVEGTYVLGWLSEWKPAAAVLGAGRTGWGGYVRYKLAGLQHWHWVHQDDLAAGDGPAPEVGAEPAAGAAPPWLDPPDPGLS